MRLTNSARQEAGLFQNIQTVPLCWNGAESLVAVAAGSRGHLTASPAIGSMHRFAITRSSFTTFE